MKTVVGYIVSVLILVAGFVGLKIFGQKPEVPTEEAASGDQAIAVVTTEVTAWDAPFNIRTDGEAVTYRVVTVGAEVKGRIVRKTAAARGGTHIEKGALLFEVDSTDYELEIDRLNAQLLQAEEELNAITVELKNTADLVKLVDEEWQLQKKHLTRIQRLQARKTATETELETAMKQELTARNTLQGHRNQERVLRQQIKTKQANRTLVATQLARAQVDLERCQVRSPIKGRIVADVVEEGNYVNPGDELVKVSDGGRMEVKTKLRAEELAWIWQQTPKPRSSEAEVPGLVDPLSLPEVPCEVGYVFEGVETIWDGYIARIEGTGVDRDTRTFPCRVLVEKPSVTRVNDSLGGRATLSPPTLLSGMYVSVRIPVTSPLPLLRIPLEAVRPGGQMWVDSNGKLDIVNVSLAHVEGDIALIRGEGSGLEAGDQVITSPLASVQQGMQISATNRKAEPIENTSDADDDENSAEAAE